MQASVPPSVTPQQSPEREQTDLSLREEREKADLEISASRQALENDADAVVELARENADAVLLAAREKADTTAASRIQGETVEHREIEDAALVEVRAVADQALHHERAARSRMLESLLPRERDATDQYLLTERARADDALASRDDFLGMVSHDLRDLLNGIMVSSQMLALKLETLSDRARLLLETTRIERYGARMNRLIGDLVDVASIDAGKLAMQKTQSDAAEVATEAVDALQLTAAARGLSLTLREMPPCSAEFDHDRILQVLGNLIANSIKFTPKGGTIGVHFEVLGEWLQFCVEDSGEGIPTAMLEAVFERFWQVGKNNRRGLGLGLYISHCIVEAHGGRIWAESSHGEGTRMYFKLPLSAEECGGVHHVER